MKKATKSGLIADIVITAVLLILLNIVTFVIPFNKESMATHLTAYLMAEVVILVQGLLLGIEIFAQKDKNLRVLGLPIIYAGFVTLIVQLIATAAFYTVNAFVSLPFWVIIIVEVFIIAYLTIQIAIGFFFKNRTVEFKEETANTKFMDEFRARLKAIVAINKNSNIEKELTDLVDIALGSDPISNEKTFDSESELLSFLQELDEAIKNGDEEDSRTIITKITTTLAERNALCKAGK